LDEEISKQEEARRILDAIRHKESENDEEQSPSKPISQLAEEDADQLQALIAQKLKAKNEDSGQIEELPDPESIDPISTEQIKVMRKYAAVQEDEEKPVKARFLDSLIKGYFEIADAFRLKPDNTKSCFKRGHECVHCGKKIPFAALEQYIKNSAADNTSDGAPRKK
jgi:hypothetical protein